jgi:hypothetical protein
LICVDGADHTLATMAGVGVDTLLAVKPDGVSVLDRDGESRMRLSEVRANRLAAVIMRCYRIELNVENRRLTSQS